MSKNYFINGKIITVIVDSNIYSKDSIIKCLYWYSNKFLVEISTTEDHKYKIELELINDSVSSSELDSYLNKLNQDLIDFNLRDIVTKETQNIRDLLVAKAFSHGEFDESPPGIILDPVEINKATNGDIKQ